MLAARQSTKAVRASTGRVAKLSVVCKAQSKVESIKAKIALAAATLPAMIVSSPAYALVDERMNGDGTGRPLGINNGAVGLAMLIVFTTVWSQWYGSQKDLGQFEDKDSGLGL